MDIKISKIASHCAACEVDFTHEQPLTSAVRVVEGALVRYDFCAPCWAGQEDKKAYSVWKTVYFDPKVESEEPPEVFSPLRQLFYEAVEEESRIERAKAFLAAGLLRRQKVFRLIKESDDSDGEVRITLYTDRIGNRLIEVPDPNFTHAEMEEAGKRLLARLQELETAAEAAEEGAEDGATDSTPDPEAPSENDAEAEMPAEGAEDGATASTPDLEAPPEDDREAETTAEEADTDGVDAAEADSSENASNPTDSDGVKTVEAESLQGDDAGPAPEESEETAHAQA